MSSETETGQIEPGTEIDGMTYLGTIRDLVVKAGPLVTDDRERVDAMEKHVWQCNGCAEMYMTTYTALAPICERCTARDCFGRPVEGYNGNVKTVYTTLEPDWEQLGKLVRDVWIRFAKRTMPNAKKSWLDPWEKCPEHVKQVDREIAQMVVAVMYQAMELNGTNSLLTTAMMIHSVPKDDPELWPAVLEIHRNAVNALVVGPVKLSEAFEDAKSEQEDETIIPRDEAVGGPFGWNPETGKGWN